jgi:hypothetical protein
MDTGWLVGDGKGEPSSADVRKHLQEFGSRMNLLVPDALQHGLTLFIAAVRYPYKDGRTGECRPLSIDSFTLEIHWALARGRVPDTDAIYTRGR